MKKWMFIIVIAVALSFSGCADTADAEDSSAIMPVENQEENGANTTSDDEIWAAIVMTWNPVHRTIDKEFTSEVDCWNYYEGGVGEGKFGTQHLDTKTIHQLKIFTLGRIT